MPKYLLSPLAPLAAKACGQLYAAWQATRGLAQRVSSPWNLPPLERGKAIEQLLPSIGLGRTLAPNFPKIDRFVNGVAGSIKSIDLRLPTYQNMAALASKLQGYINDVANFQGYGIVRMTVDTGRELILAYPAGAGTPEQWSVLNRMYAIALEAGVVLKVVPIP
jgi:filamentous hemagglutinin